MKFNEQYISYLNEAGKKTMTLYHGGNLKEGVNSSYSHRTKRWEYGPGLYLTTHYGTAASYAKGSRKLYKVTVEMGNDLDNVLFDYDKVKEFVNTHVMTKKRSDMLARMESKMKDGKVPAYMLVNLIINDEAMKPSKSGILRDFLVNNGVDYSLVSNAFGWNEMMLVLFNFNKIINIEEAKDSYEDLPTTFSTGN